MVNESVTNCHVSLKHDNSYKTAHESLCAKLQQAQTIADIVAKGNLTDGEVFGLAWCLSDLLTAAYEQCERLTPDDFDVAE